MQENDKANDEQALIRYWPLAVVGVIALVLVGVALAAAVLAILPDGNQPVATVEGADESVQLAEIAETPESEASRPVSRPPLTPQPGGRSAGDPYTPELGNSGYDIQQYNINMALDPARKVVEATVIIEAMATLDGLNQISLDFVGFEITTLTVDGSLAQFGREADKLIVDLPTPLQAGTAFDLSVAYRGEPLERRSVYLGFVDHLGLHYPDGETIFVISEPDGARFWFPANDHPRDKAVFRFELAVPSGLTAVANGQLLETRSTALPDGRLGELFIWEHNFPMAPYLAVAAVGPYVRLESTSPAGVPIRHYVLPGLEDQVLDATADLGPAIDWMSEQFGAYPFERFGVVTAKVPGGSLETQSMVLLSDRMIGRRTIIHELAHMWFGDWVSLDTWREMWRNEGFATYIQIMWDNRESAENLELEMLGVAGVVEGNDKQYPLDNPPAEYLFELNVYFQGAMAVHALRQEMGDEAFFTGLRAYFQRHGGSTASDQEFREAMESAAGRPLDDYYSRWFPDS